MTAPRSRTNALFPMPVCLLALLALTMGGCNNKIKSERDALFAQNEELQSELDQTRAALDAAQNETDRKNAELARLRGELAAKPAVQPQSRNPFAGVAGVETEQRLEGVAVRVPGDVLFASGKTELRSGSKKTLAEIAAIIRREYPGKSVRVEGYTDTDPIRKSGWDDNWELSAQRALSVVRHLQSEGIPANRLYAAGFGQTRPRGSKAQSRRVEIVVVNE